MEIQRQADNFTEVLDDYLKNIARNLRQQTSSVTFNWHQINPQEVVLEDSNKNRFRLNYAEVESFITALGLTNITHVTAKRWELDMRFNLMHVVSIRFESTNFVIHTAERNHNFDGPLLTFGLMPEPFKFDDLTRAARGYINRIGKRVHITKVEYNVPEWPTLLRFIPQEKVPLTELADIQRKQQLERNSRMEVQRKNHLDELNEQGLALLNKIHKILKRKELYEFVKARELTNPPDARAILRIVEESKQDHPHRK